MARGEYNPDVPRKGHDSIATLYRAFDEMSRQINERTREVEQSRKMYKELFEKVPCYISVVDKDYRIVRENEAFKVEFGDQVGKHCFQGRKGLVSKCENCQVEKTFADGLSHRSEEVWNPDSSDKKAYVIVHTSPILDEDRAGRRSDGDVPRRHTYCQTATGTCQEGAGVPEPYCERAVLPHSG